MAALKKISYLCNTNAILAYHHSIFELSTNEKNTYSSHFGSFQYNGNKGRITGH